jgi:hypothetical protein
LVHDKDKKDVVQAEHVVKRQKKTNKTWVISHKGKRK